MVRMLAWMGEKLKAVLALFSPMYQKARASSGVSYWVRVALHLLIVAAILAGLFWLNYYSRWAEWIQSAVKNERLLRMLWLPFLFLLLYALCWLSYWLWKLLASEEEGPRFADIEAAWEEAKFALRQARIGLSDLPLFLILGQPEDDEKALFGAAQLTLLVPQTPDSAEAPLHVYATRDAIYLTCAGASLLGCHARFLAAKLGDKTVSARQEAPNEDDDIFNATLSPHAKGNMVPNKGIFANMVHMFQQAEREGRPLTKVEKRVLRAEYRKSQPQRSPLKDVDRLAEQAARLRFLCQLVVRDRNPCCAVNGVLLLIPFAGCDTDQDAVYTAEAVQRDLEVTGAALKVDCPHYALVCDMETADGFGEFIQRFSPRQRLRRLGQSCPLNPDLRGEIGQEPLKDSVPRMLDSLAKWICRSVMPNWVYREFQLEKNDTPDRAALVRGNGQLFLLADEMQERSKRLGAILSRGLGWKAAAGPLLFGGCYLAGAGSDAEREQAFVRGVLDRLDETQWCVYWTEATRAEEASYSFWTKVGWIVLAGLVALILAAVLRTYWLV